MFHIFKYRFLCFIKDKSNLFWALIFPIGLSTLFFFAFANLGAEGKLEVIKVAVVDEGNTTFNQVVAELSKKGEDQILEVTYTSKAKAEQLVKEGEREVALISSEEPTLLYRNETLETQILQEIVQSYTRVNATVTNLAKQDPQRMSDQIMQDILANKVTIKDDESNAGSTDVSVQYFYTIIAMTCLYGAFWGLKSIRDTQANQSDRAVRVNVAPTHKLKLVAIDYLVAFIIMMIELIITFAYLILVLGVDFGNYFLQTALVSICGVFTSLGLGILLGSLSKLKNNVNIAIVSMGSLFSCFLAGMMVNTMPYMLNRVLPFVKYINPATLITNSFNILYYYEDISAVYLNMAILLGIGVIAILLSYRVLRRKAYASI